MRIIAFMNQKGGVGKTTTAANVAAGLAEMGARVLLIDLDSQTNLTTYFGLTPETQTDLYDVMCEDASFNEAIQVVDEKISLIAASKDLSGVDIELSDRADRVAVLRKKMAEAKINFDYVLMDCPPSLGLLTINALAVAGEVIVPMQAHFLAMQGMAKLLETVQVVGKQVNPRLRIAGVVLTMFDANARLSAEVIAELERFFESARGTNAPWNEARLFKSRIRRNIKITESPSFGQSVLAYDSQSNGAKDYRELAREITFLKFTPSAIDAAGAQIPASMSLVDRALIDAEKQVDSVRLIDEPITPIVETKIESKTEAKHTEPAIDRMVEKKVIEENKVQPKIVEQPVQSSPIESTPVEPKPAEKKIFAEKPVETSPVDEPRVDGSLVESSSDPIFNAELIHDDDLPILPLELPDPPELDPPVIQTTINSDLDATRLTAAHFNNAGRRKDEKPAAGDREAVA